MASNPGPSPRARIRALLRGGAVAPPPFLPLVHALASRVESVDLPVLLADPTRLAKSLGLLHQALGTDGIVCGCAAGVEAEAAGAELDWTSYPPAIVWHPAAGGVRLDEHLEDIHTRPRIAAAIEATRRLASTVPGEPALVAMLTGPLTLAAQLGGPWFQDQLKAEGAAGLQLLEAASRIGLELTRQFCSAGANLVLIVEDELPPADSGAFANWQSVVGPIANVSRFHQALPVLLPLRADRDQVASLISRPPGRALPCFTLDTTLPAAAGSQLGRAVPMHQLGTFRAEGPCALLTTAGEVSPDNDIGTLRDTCQNLLAAIRAGADAGPG